MSRDRVMKPSCCMAQIGYSDDLESNHHRAKQREPIKTKDLTRCLPGGPAASVKRVDVQAASGRRGARVRPPSLPGPVPRGSARELLVSRVLERPVVGGEGEAQLLSGSGAGEAFGLGGAGGAARSRVPEGPGEARRPEARAGLRPRRAAARRHDLSHRGRCARHDGVADPVELHGLRLGLSPVFTPPSISSRPLRSPTALPGGPSDGYALLP